jgi:hypothetical protein
MFGSMAIKIDYGKIDSGQNLFEIKWFMFEYTNAKVSRTKI